MSKVTLLAATMVVAIAPASVISAPLHAKHGPYSVLWNQNMNFGSGVNSQYYGTQNDPDNDGAADDFIVPSGQRWRVTEVDVTGAYVGGTGPASSVWINFATSKNGLPHKVRHSVAVTCTDNSGSFQCVLPTNVHGKPGFTLDSGTWWLAVIADCTSQVCGQWQWTENTTVTGNQAQWENPLGGWGCGEEWEPVNTCTNGPAADLAFDIMGTVK